MKNLIFTLFLISTTQSMHAQKIVISKHRMNLHDTLCFYNKKLVKVNVTKKNKINLSEIETTSQESQFSIQLNSQNYSNNSDGIIYPVRLSKDQNSEDSNLYWTISIDLGNDVESFTLEPVYCNNKFVIFNVIGFKKRKKFGYLHTVVYKIL